MPRSIRPTLALWVSALLLLPAAAQAQSAPPTQIDGSPLNVWVGEDGGIQAAVDGYHVGEWYASPLVLTDETGNNPMPNPVGQAGFGLIVGPEDSNGTQYFGKLVGGGSMPVPATQAPTFTPGSPATITTKWALNDQRSGAPQIELTQVVSYTNGSRQFDTTWSVHNISSAPLNFRANAAGDLAIRGSDIGVGFLDNGPPRFLGGVNQDVGAAGGFVEETPWSKFESNNLSSVAGHWFDASAGGGFDGTVLSDVADNAAGVQWDDHFASGAALQPGDTATYSLGWKFVDTLGLTPPTSKKLTGETATLTARVGNVNGTNAGDRTLDYLVVSSTTNETVLAGKVKTGADGKATISYVGGVPGTDTVVAFDDLNGNGQRDPNEPQATATIEWDGPPPPVIGESAAVRTVGKGTVKIKLPPGTSSAKAKRLGLTGAASGFVKLTEAKQIPMGSTLDTSKGTVNLLAAATKGSAAVDKYQSGNFNGGQFRLSQSRKNPLTQLSMGGGGLGGCATRVPKGGSAARKRSRHLFSSVKGRFRTRGRNSSATVRGTKWSMTDTCAGTLTAVKQGSVVVHDFTLRKNKTVKAGKHYFAKAPKLKRKK